MKTTTTWLIPKSAVKIPLPNVTQSLKYSCGILLKSILRYYGIREFTEREMMHELRMKPDGTDPWQFINVIERYRLKYAEYNVMTAQQLKYFIDNGMPVIVTVQAWGYLESYKNVWEHGHWIIAIGYDDNGFYFEDPSHKDIRGFIPYEQFEDRWHDTGNNDLPEDHYGLVVRGDKVVHKNLKDKESGPYTLITFETLTITYNTIFTKLNTKISWRYYLNIP